MDAGHSEQAEHEPHLGPGPGVTPAVDFPHTFTPARSLDHAPPPGSLAGGET